MKKRDPIVIIKLSLKCALEYLQKLNEIRKKYTEEKIQESDNLTIIHRALWTALIIEIGCLFDTYDSKEKKVISLKKLNSHKKRIDEIHGEQIICRIINTRKSFTAHKGILKNKIITADEICNSKLKNLLEELEGLIK